MRGRRRTTTPRRGRKVAILALFERDGDRLIFRVARRLDSPNAWRRHHLSGHKLMTWWTQAFDGAIAVGRGHRSVAADMWAQGDADPLRPFRGAGHAPRKKIGHPIPAADRRRVHVIRQVPTARNFLKDDDDLRYTVKPINDALRNCGFILDDRREYLEQDIPEQQISADGRDWTIVIVGPASGDYVPQAPVQGQAFRQSPIGPITEALERLTGRNR